MCVCVQDGGGSGEGARILREGVKKGIKLFERAGEGEVVAV